MTASVLLGAIRGGRTFLVCAGLTVVPPLMLLPVALLVGEAFWVRLAPLVVGGVLAAAAVILLRTRRGDDRRLEITLAAAALTVGIASVVAQVGWLGAAALITLTGTLVAAAVIWRAHLAPAVVGYRAGVRRLAAGWAMWPGPAGSVVMCAAVIGVAMIGMTAGLAPTLALAVLLLLAVGAAVLLLTAQRIEARTVTAVLTSLAIAAVPFRGLAEVQVGGIALGATEILLVGALAAWLFGRGARSRISVPAYALGLLIFAGWLTVTALVAVNPALVLKEVLKWLQIAVALVILVDVLREPSGRRIVAWAVGAAVLAQAGLGLIQTAAQAGPGGFVVGGVLRAFGTFNQPNPYGGYLGVHLPFILAALIYARGSRRRWLVLLGIVVLLGLVASRSRGAWLGVGVSSLVVVLAAAPASPWVRAVLALAAAGVLAVALAASGGTFDRTLPPDVVRTIRGEHPVEDVVRHRAYDDFAIAQRVAHWAAGWRMFQDRPLLGVGAGNFDEAFRAYALHPFDEPLGHAHNVVVNFGAEAGLPGMLMFAGLSLGSLWIAAAAVRRARGAAFEWSAVGALGALVGFATHNLVDSLFVSGIGIVFALILALALVTGSPESNPEPGRASL